MRITVAAVLVTAIAVCAAGWLLVRSVEDTQLGQVRDEINAQLERVAARLEAGDRPCEAVQGPTASPFVQVIDERGQVVGASPTFVNDGQTFVVRLDENQSGAPAGGSTSATDELGTERVPPPSCVTDPVPGAGLPAPRPDPEEGIALVRSDVMVARSLETLTRTVETPSGTLTVFAAAPVDQVARSLDALRRALVVGLPALVILVAATAWVLVGRALRPVEAIRAEVDEITGSTMHRRVPEPPTGDEIGRLARTMNAMLARLDRTATRQRQFISDASHELRSPVAAIRTGLEVARRKADTADWAAVADVALAEESRLEALLDDLLLLAAQDENGATPLRATPVDLTALTVAEAQRPRRVPVHVARAPNGAEVLVIPGAADQLARVVSNLVDNAARYARSTVQVSLARSADTVRLTVDDDGPGIPPADRERIFERFTRLDDSRARNQGGTGLGLAVVRSIVTRHRGRVWAERGHFGGARFVVELPADAATSSA